MSSDSNNLVGLPQAHAESLAMDAASLRSQQRKAPVTPGALLHALRRKWLLGMLLGAVAAAVAIPTVVLLHEPVYLASGSLLVMSKPPRLAFSVGGRGEDDFDAYKRTQVELISTDYVLNAALGNVKIESWSSLREEPDPVAWLKSRIQVSFPGNSEVMRISLEDKDPEVAAALVNAVIDAYMGEVVQVDRNRKLDRLNSLQGVYNETSEKVRAQRADLKRLAEALGGGDKEALTLKQQIALNHYATLLQKLVEVHFKKLEAELELEVASATAPDGGVEQGEEFFDSYFEKQLSNDPAVTERRRQVAGLKELLAEAKVAVKNPQGRIIQEYQLRVQQAEDALAELIKQRREEARKNLDLQARLDTAQKLNGLKRTVSLRTVQERKLEELIESVAAQAKRIGTSSFDVEMLRADIQQLESIAQRLGQEVETLKIELKSPSRVEKLGSVNVPTRPSNKRQFQKSSIVGLFAFLLPLALVSWWDALRHRVNSAQDVAQRKMKVVGTLPILPRRELHPRHDEKWRIRLRESIDGIRTVLLRENSQHTTRLIQVTSAQKGEGKTSVAAHLAASFARAHHRTLLVDLDLRRPALQRVFEVPLSPGVSECFSGRAEPAQCCQATSTPGLWILPAGDDEQTQLADLPSSAIGELLDDLRAQFDFVVIDSPPVLPVVDSLIIGQHTDAIVLSVLRDVSCGPAIEEAHQRLSSLGVRVLGTVVAASRENIYTYDRPVETQSLPSINHPA